MTYDPASEIRQLAFIVILSLILGLLIDAVAWTLVASLSAYTVWNLRQLFRLHHWLKHETPTDPPASHGLWGTTFDDIYKLQQHQLKYRARLKRVIKRFRDSTYALKDGFVMLDSQGNIDWWNPAAEHLLGLRAPDDTNQLITNLIRDPRFNDYFHREDHEKPMELPSPVNIAVTLQYQVTRFGKSDQLMMVRDVTELKHLERIRSDFVANVSHELRTPLTVIDGYLETLSDNVDDINPRWRRALEQMVAQSQRMTALISDLLLLSRIESRSASRQQQPLAVDAIINSVNSSLSPIFDSKQQTLSIDISCPQQLLGQQDQFYSLVSNLLTNASKYSDPGSQIEVRWQAVSDGAEFSVTDNGIGISPIDLPRLTERFYRVDKGRAQTVSGTGLGLAIAKHVLVNLDGKLDIKSKPGAGSTFTCHFPAHRLSMPKAAVTDN